MAKNYILWTTIDAASFGDPHEECRNYISVESSRKFNDALLMYDRVLFSTIQGDLGCGPISTLPGDEVCVLENGRVPFILSPTQTSGSLSLVEECYVHGMMDGQLKPIDYVPLTLV
jgi:hypothetical protein